MIFYIPSTKAESVVSAEQIQKISQDPQWLALLHFKKDWKPGQKSEIDGGDFFLAPRGAWDPVAELKATLDSLQAPLRLGPWKQSPRCAFQARYHFLETKLGATFPQEHCEKWEEFKSRFNNPKSVSLLFSSAYTNNPASMFGHLFLKVRSSRSSELLDMGVNYAAQVPPEENPFAFFYFGVMGGYDGHWSIQPFYEKLNEYIKSENRDLWEYELNLSPAETFFFLEHLWEVETTSRMDYYFFDDNCAYEMARMMEAVKPEWNLSGHTIYVIPGEQVKNFAEYPGVVRAVHFRPALRKKLFQKYSALSNEEKNQFFSLLKFDIKPGQVQDALVLETANSYMDYQRQLKKGQLNDQEKEFWNAVLLQRASLGSVPLETLPPISEETRPDLGHDAYALNGILGSESDGSSASHEYWGLRIKSAYHDLYNYDLGYKKYSEILFPWLEVRYRPYERKWNLEELGAVRITSLVPLSRIDFNPSWKVSFGFLSPKDFGCLDCRAFTWQTGIGLSEEIFSTEHLAYQFLNLQTEFDENLPLGYRVLPGADIGWISTIQGKWKVGGEFSYSRDIASKPLNDEFYKINFNQSYSWARNYDIRQKVQWVYPRLSEQPRYVELRLDLSYYFR